MRITLLLIYIKNSLWKILFDEFYRYEYINILHIYISKYKQFYKYKLMLWLSLLIFSPLYKLNSKQVFWFFLKKILNNIWLQSDVYISHIV